MIYINNIKDKQREKGKKMKKLFTLVVCAAVSLCAMATDYTDKLVVTVNGVSSEQTATISATKKENGNYALSLKNFILKMGEDQMPVGNIEMGDVAAVDFGTGFTFLNCESTVPITAGDDPNVENWFGFDRNRDGAGGHVRQAVRRQAVRSD